MTLPDESPKFKTGVAWYRNEAYYRAMAKHYLDAVRKVERGTKQLDEVLNAAEFNVSRLIFESNLIEGAGLPDEGKTQKVIEANFPAIPRERERHVPFFEREGGLDGLFSKAKLEEICRAIERSGLRAEAVTPSASFAGEPRVFREVVQHFQAIDAAIDVILDWRDSAIAENVRDRINHAYASNDRKREERLHELYEVLGRKPIRHRRPFTHTNLRKLHRILADGLMPEDASVPAGTYRIDNRSVGWDIAFPGPELVRPAMDGFIRQSDELLTGLARGRSGKDAIETAAEISYHFVRIHPFPDFNGRISRIIMNMVFQSAGCYVPIAIRGDGKGRKRYFSALKRANDGDMRRLETLIAMRVTETFQEIDDNLRLAGVPTLLEPDSGDAGGGVV